MKKKEPLDFTPQKSVEWYKPTQLIKTGIKALVSTILGVFDDKRETFHHDSKKYFDYSINKDELWIDYIADLADGFDATYTLAKLLASPEIEIDGEIMPRSDLLIMGGDQVYPAASREEYENRLKGPYKAAFPLEKDDDELPHLFAIPGNHDWYDSLTNFLKIFCQKRKIGNWRTQQDRSYFALKLPHKVWLFGVDIQLKSDIDKNQLNYFSTILDEEVEEDSKIILCTAEPAWIYKTSSKNEAYKNLAHFESSYANYKDKHEHQKTKQILTIAGDLHHYARYETNNGSHKITAGGGGAFMHPTHNLPELVRDLREGDIALKKTFPSSKASKSLLFRNLWFPFTNLGMATLIGGIYAIMGWVMYLHFEADVNDLPFMKMLFDLPSNPSLLILVFLLIFSLGKFADRKPYNPKFKYAKVYFFLGILHGLAQAFMIWVSFYIATWYVSSLYLASEIISWSLIEIALWVSGFLMGGCIFGVYLIIANLLLGIHDNEAYSSLKWTGYKNFLRLHLTHDKIIIYPIGITKVAKWTYKVKNGKGEFETNTQPNLQLIEDPVIIHL